MQKVLVSFLLFTGIMLVFRALLNAVPYWRSRIEQRKKERGKEL